MIVANTGLCPAMTVTCATSVSVSGALVPSVPTLSPADCASRLTALQTTTSVNEPFVPSGMPVGDALTGALIVVGMAASWRQSVSKLLLGLLKLHPVYRVAIEAREGRAESDEVPQLPYRGRDLSSSGEGSVREEMLRKYLSLTQSRFPNYGPAVYSELERNGLLETDILEHVSGGEKTRLAASMVSFLLRLSEEFRVSREETKQMLLFFPLLPYRIFRSTMAPHTFAPERDFQQKKVTEVAMKKLDILGHAQRWNEMLDDPQRDDQRTRIADDLILLTIDTPDESYSAAADFVRVMAYQRLLAYFFVFKTDDVKNLAAVDSIVSIQAMNPKYPLYSEAIRIRSLLGLPDYEKAKPEDYQTEQFHQGLAVLKEELKSPESVKKAVARMQEAKWKSPPAPSGTGGLAP